MTDTTPLASDFAPATYEKWRQLVDKALKGGDFDKKLVAKTADGLRIEPLYARADTLPGAEAAVPGKAPFTRGTHADVQGLGWQIHQRVVEADPAAANKVILEELEGGANGVVLQIAGPGQNGIKIASVDDAAATLPGVFVDYAPIQLAGGVHGLAAARHYLKALAALKPEPGGTATSRLNVDPLGTLARFGATWAPIDKALAETVAFAGEARGSERRLSSVLVDATVPHEAGASEAQELSYLAAALVAYLRAFEAAGVAPKDALPTIAFALSVDTDLFVNAAKVRAARRIIARIAEASGASPASMHITAVSSGRMMAKRDPWTNMLRTTAACAAATFGGADAITVLPYTWALGVPDRFARRVARNTQLVLQEESQLGRVVDPIGGSWYVEKLTDELAATGVDAVPGHRGRRRHRRRAVVGRAAGRHRQGGRDARQEHRHRPHRADGRIRVPVPRRRRRQGHALCGAGAGRQGRGARVDTASPRRSVREAARCGRRVPRQDRQAQAHLHGQPRRDRRAQPPLAVDVELPRRRRHRGPDQRRVQERRRSRRPRSRHPAPRSPASARPTRSMPASAEAAAKALKQAGATRVLLAGRPGEAEPALRAAGVDGFLFAGQDAVATLEELHKALAQS